MNCLALLAETAANVASTTTTTSNSNNNGIVDVDQSSAANRRGLKLVDVSGFIASVAVEGIVPKGIGTKETPGAAPLQVLWRYFGGLSVLLVMYCRTSYMPLLCCPSS